MNMKQRHHVEAAIAWAELQPRRDVVGRGRDICLTERHDLGTRGRAGRMQYQRDIVGLGGTGLRRSAARLAGKAERARARRPVRREFNQRDPELLGDGNCGRGAAGFNDQRLRVEVAHVELELVAAIGGIERRGGRSGGDAHERGRHLRAVRQHDRDAVAAPDAERVERADGFINQPAQGRIGQRRRVMRENRGRVVAPRGEEVFQSPRRSHVVLFLLTRARSRAGLWLGQASRPTV